jgi:hypothetical protein
MDRVLKFFYPKVKQIDIEQRRITACVSRDEIDRDNERIPIEVIVASFKIYSENPVLYGDHQHRLSTGKSAVIGHGLTETFRVEKDHTGRECILMDYVFSTTENAETYWINYRDGHQKAISWGFIPLNHTQEFKEKKSNLVHTEIEWVETSCVGVGSNRGALIKSKGFFDCLSEDEDESLKIKTLLDERIAPVIKEISTLRESIESSLEDIKSLLVPGSDEFADILLSGEDPVESLLCGDNDKAGQLVSRTKKAFSTFEGV